MGTRGSWGYQSRRTAYFYSMKPFCQWALEKRAPPHFMRTTECPGEEIFKSHCQGQPPEHVTLPRLQEERRHGSRKNGPTAIQPQLTAASFAFLPREDTPLPQAFLLLWRKQPSEGASPRDTESVYCTQSARHLGTWRRWEQGDISEVSGSAKESQCCYQLGLRFLHLTAP